MSKVLLIEDNDDDVLMVKRAFKKGRIGNNIFHVLNGEEGVEYFNSNNDVELILLDLNMEVMNGFEFLQVRKENPVINQVPVVVLTSSSRKEDVEKAYLNGCNAYVEKPVDPKVFIDVIHTIEDFWLFISKSPVNV